MRKFLKYSLWIVGFGLMLASSGIDGAYMSRMMPAGWGWLGLVLNTTADVAGMVLTYYYGVIRRENAKNSKKWKLARWLLLAETFSVFYSWFFGWRQLLIVMIPIEGDATVWIAPVAAFFIPGVLGFIGFTESLLADKPQEDTKKAQPAQPTVKSAQPQEKKKEKVKLNATAKKVLQSYSASPDATQTQVAQDIDVSRTTVANYLRKLESEGYLHETKDGKIIVAEDSK
jgi:hypothetical protein